MTKGRFIVVGAETDIGSELMRLLEERGLGPHNGVIALASEGSEFDFRPDDLAFLAPSPRLVAGGAASPALRIGQAIRNTGARAIDLSGAFHSHGDVPLVVPELNGEAILSAASPIVACPSPAGVLLSLVLAPFHALASVHRALVVLHVPAIQQGREGMDELFDQTRGIFVNQTNLPRCFTKQLAFNLIPHVGTFLDDGATEYEWSLAVEIKKILDPKIRVTTQAIQVPVFSALSLTANIELRNELDEDKLRLALRRMPGISLIDRRADEGYATPVESIGESIGFVSRLRSDPSHDTAFWLWAVIDTMRKGSALNAMQIAEIMIPDLPAQIDADEYGDDVDEDDEDDDV